MSGTTFEGQAGPELLLELRADQTLGRSVESALRVAVRGRRVTAGTRLPSTRVLARDIGVSRRLVVEAYEQLVAEGWLEARRRRGDVRRRYGSAGRARRDTRPVPPAGPERVPYDFFPGEPDLSAFPREAWLRALRDVLREAPDAVLGYPDPAGRPELRRGARGAPAPGPRRRGRPRSRDRRQRRASGARAARAGARPGRARAHRGRAPEPAAARRGAACRRPAGRRRAGRR